MEFTTLYLKNCLAVNYSWNRLVGLASRGSAGVTRCGARCRNVTWGLWRFWNATRTPGAFSLRIYIHSCLLDQTPLGVLVIGKIITVLVYVLCWPWKKVIYPFLTALGLVSEGWISRVQTYAVRWLIASVMLPGEIRLQCYRDQRKARPYGEERRSV